MQERKVKKMMPQKNNQILANSTESSKRKHTKRGKKIKKGKKGKMKKRKIESIWK